MWSTLLDLERMLLATPGLSRQMALRQALVAAIGQGRLLAGQRLPASRLLAQELGLARNTVVAAYDALVERGLLAVEPRQGIFVARGAVAHPPAPAAASGTLDWSTRLARHPSRQRNIVKPTDWQRYPFPFVYGQVDPELFPLATWRALSRDALGRAAVNHWAADHATADDPQLVEAIRRHVLPHRGVHPRAEEVLVTLGTQHGLFLLAALLARPGGAIGIEDPGYPDARNIFALHGAVPRRLPLDEGGLCLGAALQGLDLAIVTPAHQCPTMVTMPLDRRQALLDWAVRADALLVEDDYETEASGSAALPPLMALDRSGRVVQLGSFSKILAPGLRLGFMVGPAPLIAEARALRRLMHRSVPLNNQRTAALFLAEGHYQALLRKLGAALRARWEIAVREVERRLPGFARSPSTGGSSLWLRCPAGLDGTAFFAAARARGVLVEPGEAFFATPGAGAHHFRLGLSSIPEDRIAAGIRALAQAAEDVAGAPGPID